MKRMSGLVALALAAACAPAASGPEATVEAIYKPLADSKGEAGTSLTDMPLSADLKALVEKVEATVKDEPVLDGDFAGNCQDCSGFKDLKIAAKDGGDGHKTVEATFKLFPDEPRVVTWDMVETPEGWRVDNIVSEGIDLRVIAQEALDSANDPQPGPVDDPAVQCIAYLNLLANAVKSATPRGDTAKLDTAVLAWRRQAEGQFSEDDLAQYVAAGVAKFDGMPADQLQAQADACVAKAP